MNIDNSVNFRVITREMTNKLKVHEKPDRIVNNTYIIM